MSNVPDTSALRGHKPRLPAIRATVIDVNIAILTGNTWFPLVATIKSKCARVVADVSFREQHACIDMMCLGLDDWWYSDTWARRTCRAALIPAQGGFILAQVWPLSVSITRSTPVLLFRQA